MMCGLPLGDPSGRFRLKSLLGDPDGDFLAYRLDLIPLSCICGGIERYTKLGGMDTLYSSQSTLEDLSFAAKH
jgi:hypothetical protein